MAKTPTEIRSLARQHTARAIATLAGIMNEPSAPVPSRIQACSELLSRGWGKPTTLIAGDDGFDPLRVKSIAWLDVLDPNARVPQAIEDQSGETLQLAAEPAEPAENVSIPAADVSNEPVVILPQPPRVRRERVYRTEPARRAYMRELMARKRERAAMKPPDNR